MTILHVFLLVAAAFCTMARAKEMMYDASKDFELKKPLVVPAAEASYHNTMIEVDTMVSGNNHSPVFGLIGVMLLDGVFTFSGIPEENLQKLPTSQDGHRCIPFKGINVVTKCNHEYFALNADFVQIQKTPFFQKDSFTNVCINRNAQHSRKFNAKNDVGLKGSGTKDLVVRFGNRILMAYKAGANHHKCIGTYDFDDDYFTCMMPGKNGMEGFEMGSFLYETLQGNPHRADNTVEVFCKLPHVYGKE